MKIPTTEEWRPVVGYESFYEVSNQGRVRTVPRRVTCGPNPNRTRLVPSKILASTYIQGYAIVMLNAKTIGKKGSAAIHRLVASAFLEPKPSPSHQVNHKNSIRDDNRAENLEWVTPAGNIHHARDNGRLAHGETHPSARLSEKDVLAIHDRSRSGERRHHLASEYGVSNGTIDAILQGRIWKHLLPEDYQRPVASTAGECNGAAKLTAIQVDSIRQLYATGCYSTYALATQFDVSQGAIALIVRGRTWRNRLLMRQEPDLDGFFETRELQTPSSLEDTHNGN